MRFFVGKRRRRYGLHFRDVETTLKAVAPLIELFGKSWAAVHVVVLDTSRRQPLEHSGDLTKQFHLNPASMMFADGGVVLVGMQTPWYTWYLHFTPQSIGCAKPLVMWTKKLFQRVVTPSLELFHDPQVPHDIYVLQAYTSWLPEPYQFLSVVNTNGDEVLDSDTQNTKYVFAQLAYNKIQSIVERFGGKERLAIQTLLWYKGEFDYFPDCGIVGEQGTASRSSSVFVWPYYEPVLGGRNCPHVGYHAVQLVSYNKVRIGLSHADKKQCLEALPKLLALGLNGKPEWTGEWINEMDSTKAEEMKDLASVETCCLTEKLPYWKEIQIKQLFTGVDVAKVVVKTKSWSVGTLRTSTWKHWAQTVKDLVGKALTSSNGKHQRAIVTEAEYQFRRPTNRPRLPARRRNKIRCTQGFVVRYIGRRGGLTRSHDDSTQNPQLQGLLQRQWAEIEGIGREAEEI